MTTNEAEIVKSLLDTIDKDTDLILQISKLLKDRATKRTEEIGKAREQVYSL